MAYTVEELRDRGPEPTMELLLSRIPKRAIASYGEIARMLQSQLGVKSRIFPVHIGAVAGELMDLILRKSPDAPLINLLVVAEGNGLPSRGCYGYIERRRRLPKGSVEKMASSERKALIDDLSREVFDYDKWAPIFRGVFKHAPAAPGDSRLERFTEKDGRPESWGGRGGGESDEHKRLKRHILDNPHCVDIDSRSVQSKRPEQKLLSGDSVDVFFSTDAVSYLVEVKSILSSEDDLKRGIYQCLKYRVVLAAHYEKALDTDEVTAILVTEIDLPPDLKKLAKRLGIKTFTVRVNP
jgi:hypothetical protein